LILKIGWISGQPELHVQWLMSFPLSQATVVVVFVNWFELSVLLLFFSLPLWCTTHSAATCRRGSEFQCLASRTRCRTIRCIPSILRCADCWCHCCHISTLSKSWIFRIVHDNLWSPYGIGRPYIFSCCGLFFLLSFFSSPNLSRHRLDVCHTSTHGVALVRI